MKKPMFPILHVWWDELCEIVKDEGILIFVILLPLAYPLLYAMIYNTETQRQLPICVVDDCMSDRSREFIRRVDATPEVKIAASCVSMDEAQELMRRRDVFGIMRIPREFDLHLWRGEQTVIGLYSDLTSMLYYKVEYLAVINVAQEMNRNIKVKERQTNTTAHEEDVARWPIRFEEVKMYNSAGGFAAFLIPPSLARTFPWSRHPAHQALQEHLGHSPWQGTCPFPHIPAYGALYDPLRDALVRSSAAGSSERDFWTACAILGGLHFHGHVLVSFHLPQGGLHLAFRFQQKFVCFLLQLSKQVRKHLRQQCRLQQLLL